MLRSIWIKPFVFMEYLRRSFMIIEHNSLLDSGSNFNMLLELKIWSAAYHPQTDGQTERINQILEDMLRACVLQYDKNWDKCLSLAEFSYNNSYQTSLKMAPFESLYGRQCWTPLSWSQTGKRKIFRPDLVTEAEEKVRIIQNNLKAANLDRKATLTYEEDRYNSKLEVSYIFEYLLLEVFNVSA
jgi:hypothetical protein